MVMTKTTMSCCIGNYCGMPYDMAEPELRDQSTLKAFWRLYCPEHRVPTEPNVIIVGQPMEDKQ